MPEYHGWTHRPKEQGGTDPIPGTGSLAVFRAWDYPSYNIGDALQTALKFRYYENSDASVFSPVIAGSPAYLTRVDLIPFGVYSIFCMVQYDLSGQWETEFTLVNDYVSIGETPYSQVFAQAVPDHVIVSPSFSITKSFPVPEDIGGQDNGTISKVCRVLIYHTQFSGTGDKSPGQVYLDITYHGLCEPGTMVDVQA